MPGTITWTERDVAALERIQERVLWLATYMVHHANHLRPPLLRDRPVRRSLSLGRQSAQIENPELMQRGDVMTIKDLEAFFDNGWNRHDVDAVMTFMADDCVFDGAAGPDVCGTRYEGRERVREAFARVFAAVSDVKFDDARHLVAGDRGVWEWIFTGTTTDGKKVEVNGCDLFTFRNGKIALKSSYLKNGAA